MKDRSPSWTLPAIPYSPRPQARASACFFGAVAVFTLGDGLFQPAMNAIIANATPDPMRGRVQGANQARQAVARVLAPLAAALLYGWHPSAPYVAGGTLIVIAFVFFARR